MKSVIWFYQAGTMLQLFAAFALVMLIYLCLHWGQIWISDKNLLSLETTLQPQGHRTFLIETSLFLLLLPLLFLEELFSVLSKLGKFLILADKGGGGSENPSLADIICEQPLSIVHTLQHFDIPPWVYMRVMFGD